MREINTKLIKEVFNRNENLLYTRNRKEEFEKQFRQL
jgi:hypothetical protein